MENRRCAYSFLLGGGGGILKKEPTGKPRRKWKDNIRQNLVEIRQEGLGLVQQAEIRDK
jgi:hypothetical protein